MFNDLAVLDGEVPLRTGLLMADREDRGGCDWALA